MPGELTAIPSVGILRFKRIVNGTFACVGPSPHGAVYEHAGARAPQPKTRISTLSNRVIADPPPQRHVVADKLRLARAKASVPRSRSGGFEPLSDAHWDNVTPSSSTPQSETSTLCELLDEIEQTSHDEYASEADYRIDEENRAWTGPRSCGVISFVRRFPRFRESKPAEAKDVPISTRASEYPPSKKIFSRSNKVVYSGSMRAELLDEENQAWM
ncbi:hypothetical protein BC834DRAFT_965284 [Gloeopeniophorella convolvens]|nr:hypothetical protein BC834DRAFT_965284 [Gloeopeniophorella convolvens]